MTPQCERVGILVIRAWVYPAGPSDFRARITETSDLNSEERSVAASANPDDVLRVVEAWLARLLSRNVPSGSSCSCPRSDTRAACDDPTAK